MPSPKLQLRIRAKDGHYVNDLGRARAWVEAWVGLYDEVASVFLVGSRANGTATATSDWDFIVVVTPTFPDLSAFDGLTYGWLTREDGEALGIAPVGTPVHVYVMRTDEYDQDEIDLFAARGVPLWRSNGKEDENG